MVYTSFSNGRRISSGGNGQYRNNFVCDRQNARDPAVPFQPLTVDNYVDLAEKIMNSMLSDEKRNQKKSNLSTSKIRNLLAMSSEILFKATSSPSENQDTLTSELKADLAYFRIRCAYEIGREPGVRELDLNAHLLEHLKSIKTISECILFCHFLEALVAYHEFLSSKD